MPNHIAHSLVNCKTNGRADRIARAERVPRELIDAAKPMRELRRPRQCSCGILCWVECGPSSVRNRNGNQPFCIECDGLLGLEWRARRRQIEQSL